ncbi:MAG: hypothetical protein GY696_20775 [Gammaproteobacteria bacterium]|nr:hypothetical protein [Gammaproteobacteria bacterium]
MSIRSSRDARKPANYNQDASMIFHENMDGQLAVLPPAVVDSGAEGKGVRQPPPLLPEGEEEGKGGGEKPKKI